MFHRFVVWLVQRVGQWALWACDPDVSEIFAFPFLSQMVIPPVAYLPAIWKNKYRHREC